MSYTLNFLQHTTPNYIEHLHSHFTENLYLHKTKTIHITAIKRKRGRPPKSKTEIPNSKYRTLTAVKNPIIQLRQIPRSPNNDTYMSNDLQNQCRM